MRSYYPKTTLTGAEIWAGMHQGAQSVRLKRRIYLGVIIHRNVRFLGGILEKDSNIVPPRMPSTTSPTTMTPWAHKIICMRYLGRLSAAKAQMVAGTIRIDITSTSRAQVPSIIAPASPTNHSLKTVIGTLGVPVGVAAWVVVFAIPVTHPLPDITPHIIKTIVIGRISLSHN